MHGDQELESKPDLDDGPVEREDESETSYPLSLEEARAGLMLLDL